MMFGLKFSSSVVETKGSLNPCPKGAHFLCLSSAIQSREEPRLEIVIELCQACIIRGVDIKAIMMFK